METKTHCHFCGESLVRRFIEGRERLYCRACARPIYDNPIPATCMVVVDAAGQVLLVKRSVEPKIGMWCLPGGFLELGETPEAGALRELAEETGLNGNIDALLGVCTTPSTQYGTVLMVGYLITDARGLLVAGDDAAQVRWFPVQDMPPIAFECHQHFLDQYFCGTRK
jgi:8-oxo-dGTP diphosphatase